MSIRTHIHTQIRSLLEGQIFLIQSKNKNKALTKNFLSI